MAEPRRRGGPKKPSPFGAFIDAALERRGWTRDDLVRALDVGTSTIHHLLSGRRLWNGPKLERLFAVLEFNADEKAHALRLMADGSGGSAALVALPAPADDATPASALHALSELQHVIDTAQTLDEVLDGYFAVRKRYPRAFADAARVRR